MNDDNKIITLKEKQGFLQYLSSFFVGWVLKDYVEDELRVATNSPKLPAMSIRSVFTKETKEAFVEVGKNKEWGEVSKGVGKELAIDAASILPGAALGYFLLAPVITHAVQHSSHAHKPSASALVEADHQGMIAAQQKDQRKG